MPDPLLWRRPVPLTVDASGHLVPAGTPSGPEPAVGEAYLLRDLAQLADASNDEIAAFASRHGVLHPAELPLAELEPTIELVVGDWIRAWRADLEGLRRWVATGAAVAIPGRLAPHAHVLIRAARLPGEVQADVERLVSDGVAAVEDPSGLIATGWAALADAASQSADVMRLRNLEDEDIQMPLPAGTTSTALQWAFRVVRDGLDMASRRAANFGGELRPGWLSGLVAQYGVTPGLEAFPFAAPESTEAWRAGAREAANWRGAIQELRAAPRGWTPRRPARLRYLQALRLSAGLPPALAGAVEPITVTDREAYRAELTAILTRRLQQESAWPRPRAGVAVLTMGRVLWSAWPTVTMLRPPRRCAWAGCQEELPPDAHGNRRYCEPHRVQAARERAARRYARDKAARPTDSAG